LEIDHAGLRPSFTEINGPLIELVDQDMLPDRTAYHLPLEAKDKASLKSIGFSHCGEPA
jgi:hypothetical protein